MIEVRAAANEAEAARSNEIYNAVTPRFAFTNEETEAFKDAMLDAEEYLAFVDGVASASAFTAIRPERPDIAFALVTVLHEHRRRGLGTALFAAASSWVAARNSTEVEGFVDEDDRESIAFVEKRGFRTLKRYERLALDLTALDDPAAEAVDGVEVRTWDGDEPTARGIYAVSIEGYRDEPGAAADDAVEPFDEWLEHDIHRLEESGGATFVARAGDDVVGYAQLTLTLAQPGTASHSFTAVRRDWRGRGVAGSLKRAQIVWAKARGLEQLVTQNEERNEPMLRLNARLGYRYDSARLLVRGPLSGAV